MTDQKNRSRPDTLEFVLQAETLSRSGQPAEAERRVREGLATHPDCADGVLLLARLLLERDCGDDALRVIERYAAVTQTGPEAPKPAAEAFAAEVSEDEIDLAFAHAEPEREQMFDADAVAESAIRQTDPEFSGAFEFADSSFATSTVAGLLEEQGDSSSASAIRERVGGPTETNPGSAVASAHRDHRAATVAELERWLTNLQGEMR